FVLRLALKHLPRSDGIFIPFLYLRRMLRSRQLARSAVSHDATPAITSLQLISNRGDRLRPVIIYGV
ncbi:MAG: hypothetical protein QNJ04_10305, partial [Desulfobacterales bacterium]|nr:hypothetical protein [Desulfobacterales bacterium]